MPGERVQTITRLLRRARDGDDGAYDELLPLVYEDLRSIARRHMAGQPDGHTLQATDLLHEAWMKLTQGDGAAFEDRGHFLRVASTAMRTILVDHARSKLALKRGAGRRVGTSPSAFPVATEADHDTVLAINDAVEHLEEVQPALARLVEMRLFGGLTHAEVAEVLGVTIRTVERDWRAARAWLERELGGGGDPP